MRPPPFFQRSPVGEFPQLLKLGETRPDMRLGSDSDRPDGADHKRRPFELERDPRIQHTLQAARFGAAHDWRNAFATRRPDLRKRPVDRSAYAPQELVAIEPRQRRLIMHTVPECRE